ncbi:MAG: response regulator transcription factor [Bacteroidales bacterium]|nr:response regulator transcription factor [Bacteroidales bacterium]
MEMKDINILLAEDDKNLGTVLKAYLDAKKFNTTLKVNGKEAYDEFIKGNYDFLILDVMMPVKDGFTLAAEIRETDKETPILFLTAKSLPEDKMKGFKLGADDYLTKPFSMEELLARIEAILRRTQAHKTPVNKEFFTIGKFSFDVTRHILSADGESQKLTSKEAELLKMLCANKNETLDRSEALKHIWHDDSYFNARSMDVYVTKLRKYLKSDPTIEILNVHGVGFKLITE